MSCAVSSLRTGQPLLHIVRLHQTQALPGRAGLGQMDANRHRRRHDSASHSNCNVARAASDSLSNPPAVEAVLAGRCPVLEALLQTEAPARCVCTELLLPSPAAAMLLIQQRPSLPAKSRAQTPAR